MVASENPRRIGLDTSVVLRLLVGDPPDQARVALETVQDAAAAGRLCLVSDLVVAEAYFALHAHYGVPKKEAVTTLRDFLRSDLVQPEGAALEALEATARASRKLGFLDRLIHAQYARASVSLATFEKAAARLPSAVLLKPSRRREA
jgi:predicted nucleic acid-binding protein